MEKKGANKGKFINIFLMLAIVVIIAMGCYIFVNNSNMTKEIEDLKSNISDKQSTIETLKDNNISNTTNKVNSSISNTTSINASNTDEVSYEIVKISEGRATIKATKNGKIISKDFEMDAMIDQTGTIEIKDIGKVALVSESGGEFCKVHVYQLVNNEIKELGNIDCGADMNKDANYTVTTKGQGTAVINATLNIQTITKEFDMSAAIKNTDVINILNYGKVVLVAETGGEYYGIQVYRLSQDYIMGKDNEIKNVGLIQVRY